MQGRVARACPRAAAPGPTSPSSGIVGAAVPVGASGRHEAKLRAQPPRERALRVVVIGAEALDASQPVSRRGARRSARARHRPCAACRDARAPARRRSRRRARRRPPGRASRRRRRPAGRRRAGGRRRPGCVATCPASTSAAAMCGRPTRPLRAPRDVVPVERVAELVEPLDDALVAARRGSRRSRGCASPAARRPPRAGTRAGASSPRAGAPTARCRARSAGRAARPPPPPRPGPPSVSWSVSASVRRPSACACSTSAAGVSSPSEADEWQWRSIRLRRRAAMRSSCRTAARAVASRAG